ncbi:EndoU domain-containing protein [Gandjariella thermophila]|uniref:Bacterial EndoU nuclease domain-containing protein n=1 Tax=Gandjariella thermophila TaxID=1931992 RepID=A0A4D4JAG4_9PSEU|nr:hypothetical protein GTS_52940 [Gandjariella thermophila]
MRASRGRPRARRPGRGRRVSTGGHEHGHSSDDNGPSPIRGGAPQPPDPSAITHTPTSAQHILDGDGGKQGGHRAGTGVPGKSEFPKNWSDQDILDRSADIARTSKPVTPAKLTNDGHGNKMFCWDYVGVRDGVKIRVTVLENGHIRTAYPESGPGVVKNPPAINPPPKGTPLGASPRYRACLIWRVSCSR